MVGLGAAENAQALRNAWNPGPTHQPDSLQLPLDLSTPIGSSVEIDIENGNLGQINIGRIDCGPRFQAVWTEQGATQTWYPVQKRDNSSDYLLYSERSPLDPAPIVAKQRLEFHTTPLTRRVVSRTNKSSRSTTCGCLSNHIGQHSANTNEGFMSAKPPDA